MRRFREPWPFPSLPAAKRGPRGTILSSSDDLRDRCHCSRAHASQVGPDWICERIFEKAEVRSQELQELQNARLQNSAALPETVPNHCESGLAQEAKYLWVGRSLLELSRIKLFETVSRKKQRNLWPGILQLLQLLTPEF